MDDATKIKIDARFENLQIGRDKTKDMFFNDSKSNDNFVIKNNVFRNSRRYGMLIQAKNGIIEGNILENLSTGAITLQNSASWPEGFVPRNIVIENNKIRNAGFDPVILGRRQKILLQYSSVRLLSIRNKQNGKVSGTFG